MNELHEGLRLGSGFLSALGLSLGAVGFARVLIATSKRIITTEPQAKVDDLALVRSSLVFSIGAAALLVVLQF